MSFAQHDYKMLFCDVDRLRGIVPSVSDGTVNSSYPASNVSDGNRRTLSRISQSAASPPVEIEFDLGASPDSYRFLHIRSSAEVSSPSKIKIYTGTTPDPTTERVHSRKTFPANGDYDYVLRMSSSQSHRYFKVEIDVPPVEASSFDVYSMHLFDLTYEVDNENIYEPTESPLIDKGTFGSRTVGGYKQQTFYPYDQVVFKFPVVLASYIDVFKEMQDTPIGIVDKRGIYRKGVISPNTLRFGTVFPDRRYGDYITSMGFTFESI